jgi:hypothetical protein
MSALSSNPQGLADADDSPLTSELVESVVV